MSMPESVIMMEAPDRMLTGLGAATGQDELITLITVSG
jgi:hypothetical protein